MLFWDVPECALGLTCTPGFDEFGTAKLVQGVKMSTMRLATVIASLALMSAGASAQVGFRNRRRRDWTRHTDPASPRRTGAV